MKTNLQVRNATHDSRKEEANTDDDTIADTYRERCGDCGHFWITAAAQNKYEFILPEEKKTFDEASASLGEIVFNLCQESRIFVHPRSFRYATVATQIRAEEANTGMPVYRIPSS